MNTPYAERYLSKEEVAERYDMSPRALDRMLRHIDADQRLPPPSLYMQRLPYWSVLDLDRFEVRQIELSKSRAVRRLGDEFIRRPATTTPQGT